MKLLSELGTGQRAVIVKILGHGAFRKRVMEMGFVKGRIVKVILHAPLKDPIKYEVMGSEVGLRKSEASLIEVVPIDHDDDTPDLGSAKQPAAERLSFDEESARREAVQRHHVINVALIGNPNCGKTSLFNVLTGGKEHVGNYSGVTVDAVDGHFEYKGYRFNMIDLPGTYSLSSYSPEELYVRKYLRDSTPDIIINVVDASNLERNLYLTTELIDTNRSMVIALNMYDELRASGSTLDYPLLGDMIGVPIVPTVAKDQKGIHSLLNTVIDVFEGQHASVRHIHVRLGSQVEQAVNTLNNRIKAIGTIGHRESPRYLAIKMLEGDAETIRYINQVTGSTEIAELRDKLVADVEREMGSDITEIIAAEKYGFISGALAETMTKGETASVTRTAVIDSLVTDKLFGFPLFLAILMVMFWLTFALGQYPMDWIDAGVSALSGLVNDTMSDGILKDLIADGIIGGVGGVIVFLPNILILYFCISFMEDSGYMARAAFIMDKIMHRIGLHGKSFIPLVMGFGCNVPAIMATRTIESRSSRLITILINPFMSCSARIPIYVLLAGTFFPQCPTLVFMSLYVLGILVAVVTARLLRKFLFKRDETPFVMELPPYRMPTWRNLLIHMWAKGEQYLKKMGGIILVASIIVWALNYFPKHDLSGKLVAADTESNVESVASADHSQVESVAAAGNVRTETSGDNEEAVAVGDDASQLANTATRDSYLEMVGKTINPVMEPIGFNWPATVAALAGVPAKEIVVSTLGVLYTSDEAVSDARLSERIQADSDSHTPGALPGFTWASALAFMVFVLLYCPCIATLTAIYRESGSWRYPAFSIVYNTAVAWLLAFIVYRTALLFM